MKIALKNSKDKTAMEFFIELNTHAPVRPQRIGIYQATYEYERTINHQSGARTVVMKRVEG